MLALNNISKTFNTGTPNEKTIFKDFNLTVEDEDFISIIGSNGAGKSTLLNIIAGAYPVDRGTIRLDGTDITKFPEHKKSYLIGRVFQDPLKGTAPSMTIEENLAMALNRGKKLNLSRGITKKDREYFKEQLSLVDLGLENRLTDRVELLSGGQRQVLTLIMATMTKPKLLLLDEHTAALDPKTAELVNSLTNHIINQNKITTLMITHNMEHAITTGNRLLMMHEGDIIFDMGGAEKKKTTVSGLLNKFEEVQKISFNTDRVMLAY